MARHVGHVAISSRSIARGGKHGGRRRLLARQASLAFGSTIWRIRRCLLSGSFGDMATLCDAGRHGEPGLQAANDGDNIDGRHEETSMQVAGEAWAAL